ncbi:ABC transporter substrate-binding protein [Dactylosporangium salmoneum]|uniref:ABC transporter substrate-binding protein n=1 Tax=Dactylosporangium salmoneum TaxID=53361 RepID=A0ABN3FYL3_9ACTN
MVSRRLRVCVVGVLVAALAGCGGAGDGADGGKQEITFGGLVTTSGVNAYVGVSASKAYTVAVNMVNADPARYLGSADRSVKVEAKDAGETAPTAVALARSMAADSKYVGLVGPSTSPQALALGPLAQSSKIPLVVPGSPAPGITDAGDRVFQMAATNDVLAEQVIQAVVPKQHLTKVGVIYSPDNNANLVAGKSAINALAKAGAAVVEFTIPATDQDYTSAVAKMRDANCDGVFIATNSGGVAAAIIQAERTGYHPQWLGGPMFANDVVFKNAGQSAVGSVITTDYNPNLRTDLNDAFRSAYQKEANTPADVYAAQAFSTVLTLAAAIKSIPASEKVTRDKLTSALATAKDVEVVVSDGKLSMGADRRTQINAALLRLDSAGKFTPYE